MRIPAKGCNVSARSEGSSEERIVCCAHIDSKQDTPGALDNATGVVTLLLLAKLAREYKSRLGLEILALNGEDHYSAAGEIEFLRRAGDQISNVWLAINLDSPGYKEGKTAYSLYGCPKNVEKTLRQVFERYPDIISGDPWYQSDHSIFIQNGRPAVAITSEQLQLLTCDITHTPLDQIDLVDPRKLVELAEALHVFISAC
jgi:aminopeptidase YwaD